MHFFSDGSASPAPVQWPGCYRHVRNISRRKSYYLLGALLLATAVQGAAPAPFNGDAAAGARKADDERCRECHGENGDVGADNESARIPRLAGQHPQYLLKQLRDFASGARKHEFMNRVAADLDPQDAADIIAYYVSRTDARGRAGKPSGGTPAGPVSPAAQRLFLEGDAARSLASCASCHGDDGRTAAAQPAVPAELIPVIGGQDRHYLLEQLLNWRSGARSNSPDAMMNRALHGLTDAEVQGLAEYLETL